MRSALLSIKLSRCSVCHFMPKEQGTRPPALGRRFPLLTVFSVNFAYHHPHLWWIRQLLLQDNLPTRLAKLKLGRSDFSVCDVLGFQLKHLGLYCADDLKGLLPQNLNAAHPLIFPVLQVLAFESDEKASDMDVLVGVVQKGIFPQLCDIEIH